MSTAEGRLLLVLEEQRCAELTQQLKGQGFTLAFAEDSDSVFEHFDSSTTDLVMLDIRNTHVNAYQVLRKLKGDPKTKGIPVVVLSSTEGVESIARCLEMGADDYLIEPFHDGLVRTRIVSAMDRQRLRLQLERDSREAQRTEEALQQREKYERDVQIGRQIQQSFLPETLPQPEGWEFAARFQPARQVAGDWYDAFPLPHMNRYGVLIADVCDKGVGAALFMALMRSLIRAFASQPAPLRWMDSIDHSAGTGPAMTVAERRRSLPQVGSTSLRAAIEQTNNYIAKNHASTGMFATVFLGMLDPGTGTMLYINGGHEKPILIGANGVKGRLEPTGLAVGMLADSEYTIGSARLEPGDILFTYTDGVPEARDPDRKFFKEQRVLALCEQPVRTAGALLDRVLDNVRAHIADADQYDDVTMLAVRRLPTATK